jgi:diadenosine tetraphosphate (Ap4A) HIT family hydrolase
LANALALAEGRGFFHLAGLDTLTGMMCPFCDLEGSRIVLENDVGVVLRDAFPVTEGHTLVVPKQHVASLFDLDTSQQAALWRLAAEVRTKLAQEFHPDGFNVGVNDGRAAGQTVMHAHIHVIPRYVGDASDPRGGIRWVMSRKARYWSEDR